MSSTADSPAKLANLRQVAQVGDVARVQTAGSSVRHGTLGGVGVSARPLLDRAGTRCDAGPSAGRGNRAAVASVTQSPGPLWLARFVTLIGAARTRLAISPAARAGLSKAVASTAAGAVAEQAGLAENGRAAKRRPCHGRWRVADGGRPGLKTRPHVVKAAG